MSPSLSAAAIGDIIGLLRPPSRKACSWATRYPGFCPARLGQISFVLIPSVPWHAEQVAVFALPAAASPAATDETLTLSAASANRVRNLLMMSSFAESVR